MTSETKNPFSHFLPHFSLLFITSKATKVNLVKSEEVKIPNANAFGIFGWGGEIRTHACSSQSAVSYRLTAPQYSFIDKTPPKKTGGDFF